MNKRIISFIDANNSIIHESKITSLPLKEKCIIEKSIEVFNDPEPCFIHRSAIMKMIYVGLEDYIIELAKQGESEVLWDQFPEAYRDTLDIKGSVHKVSFK